MTFQSGVACRERSPRKSPSECLKCQVGLRNHSLNYKTLNFGDLDAAFGYGLEGDMEGIVL